VHRQSIAQIPTFRQWNGLTYPYSTIVKGLRDIILMVPLTAEVFFLILPTVM